MHNPQRFLEYLIEHYLRMLFGNIGLGKLDIPVAELVPEELIQGRGCLVKSVIIYRGFNLFQRLIEPAQDPLIRKTYAFPLRWS